MNNTKIIILIDVSRNILYREADQVKKIRSNCRPKISNIFVVRRLINNYCFGRKKDGSITCVSMAGVPMKVNNENICFYFMYANITK